jgi:hypothetical protein
MKAPVVKAKISRRKLIAAAAGTAVASAQSGPAQPDLARAAREQNQRSGEVLTKFELPIATEPAFHFKA